MDLTRRDLLAAGALLPLAAACTTAEEPGPQAVDPDVALRAGAVAREQALLDLYDAALAAVPGQALWTQLRADHAAHLDRLLPQRPTAAPSAAAAPVRPVAALRRELLVLERSTARAHAAGVPTASRDLAAVLASLAACESSHAAVL